MNSRRVGTVRELVGFLRSDRSGAALVRGGAGSLTLKLLHAGLTLLVAVILARFLGPAQYGIYAFAFALVALLAIPVQMGLPVLVVRETAAGRARQDWNVVGGIWRWSLRVVLVGSALVVVTVGVLMFGGWGEMSTAARWTFFWALPMIPLLALGALYGAALRGLNRVVLGQLPDHVLRLGCLAALILVWWFWTRDFSAPAAMALHLFAALLAVVIAHAMLQRFRPASLPQGQVDRERSRGWLMSIVPLGFISAAHVINTRADTILLGVLSDAESVGIYQVAVQGAQAVTVGLAAINLVVAPRFAALHERGQKEKLQRLVTLSARAVAYITLPVVLVLVFAGGFLIRTIFGVEYQPAHLPLAILAAGQLVNAGFGSVAMLLNMTGHERATARGLAMAAGLNIVLNLLLIPPFGISGAAAATALSLAAWNLVLWRSARQLLGIDTLVFGWTQSGRV